MVSDRPLSISCLPLCPPPVPLCLSLQTHLPGFVEQAAELRTKGVQEVACIAVNDAFVMAAWGKEHGAEGKVRPLI